MALFKKRKTIKRCKTLSKYVQGIDDAMVDRMSNFLLEDKNNTIQVTREYLMFVTAAGVVASSMAIVPLRDDFNAVVMSSSWARVQAPYQSTGDCGSSMDSTSAGTSVHDDNEEDADSAGGSWSEFSDSDGDSFTNNNNNNNNNNNG